jgi:hypothetical protein
VCCCECSFSQSDLKSKRKLTKESGKALIKSSSPNVCDEYTVLMELTIKINGMCKFCIFLNYLIEYKQLSKSGHLENQSLNYFKKIYK